MFQDNRNYDKEMYGTEKKEYMHHEKYDGCGYPDMMPQGAYGYGTYGYGYGAGYGTGCGCYTPPMVDMCPPVVECPQEKYVNRPLIHEVPHH